jgi:hypothetical protein
MKYMRKAAQCTWLDYKTKRDCKEQNITPVLDKAQEYRRNCLQHTKECLVIDY